MEESFLRELPLSAEGIAQRKEVIQRLVKAPRCAAEIEPQFAELVATLGVRLLLARKLIAETILGLEKMDYSMRLRRDEFVDLLGRSEAGFSLLTRLYRSATSDNDDEGLDIARWSAIKTLENRLREQLVGLFSVNFQERPDFQLYLGGL